MCNLIALRDTTINAADGKDGNGLKLGKFGNFFQFVHWEKS